MSAWNSNNDSILSLTMPGRETFLVKVDWVDDWPVFNDGKNIAILTQGRDPQQIASDYAVEVSKWTADLNETNLELGWYQKSTFT